MPEVSRLVLTGFMGAGKTTVGRLAAAQLGWVFVDADAAIVEQAGRAIPEFFAQQGEPAFRTLEAQVICELLAQSPLVLALGGGALEAPETRLLLASTPGVAVVYLAAPYPVLLERCQAASGLEIRPVLSAPDLRERFARRLEMYEKAATLTLDSAAHSPPELAKLIVKLLPSSMHLP